MYMYRRYKHIYLAASQSQKVGQMGIEGIDIVGQTTHLPFSFAVAHQMPAPTMTD